MKILQVSPYFRPHIGGVESHVYDLSRKLVERGHDVTVATSMFAELKPREMVHGVKVVRLRPFAIWFKTPIAPRLKEYILECDADIIHAHSPPPFCSYFAARACATTKKPLVVTYHCDLELPITFGPLIVGLYRRTFGSYTVRRADSIIVTTATYAATSRALWRSSPAVIPNAVNIERFNPEVDGKNIREKHGIGEDDKVILFVGRIVGHKGIEHLIESMKYVEDATCLIAGDGELLKELKALAKNLGVERKVIFIGRVPFEDLPRYYAASDVCVLPSVSRLEAFGIAALEAMASGKPVVVSDIPGVREVISDGKEGLISDPVNPEDLATKISTLLADKRTRTRMGALARRRVEERFTMDRVADQIERLYERLIGS